MIGSHQVGEMGFLPTVRPKKSINMCQQERSLQVVTICNLNLLKSFKQALSLTATGYSTNDADASEETSFQLLIKI